MKRGLVLSLCTAMVAAMASPALAAVDVQLNLRYTDPNNPTGGGTWDLLVKSSALNGLAGIALDIGGNLGVTGVDTPLAAITPNAGVFNNTDQVFRFEGDATSTHIATGDDLAGTLRLNVGKVGGPGVVPQDDLFHRAATPTVDFWDNSSLIASGSWTGARPTMVAANIQANEFIADGADAGTDPDVALATLGTVSVRGDSVGVDGLRPGDANRDGIVNASDFSALSGNYQQAGAKTWDQGDFNSTATGTNEVSAADFSALSGNYSPPNGPSPNPPISAVPEPSSMILFSLALLGLGRCAKRS